MIIKERYRKFLKLWMARVKLKKENGKDCTWVYDIYLEKIWVAVLYKSGEYNTNSWCL